MEIIMNMSKPTKTIFSTVAVFVFITFASIASVNASDNEAAFDGPREHQRKMHKVQRMAKVLSLSEQQLVQIKEVTMLGKEQHQVLRASMKQFKIAENKLVQTEKFDEQAFNALHDAYRPIFAQSALIRVKTRHAVFNVLTTEQQEKWLKAAENHKGHDKKVRG